MGYGNSDDFGKPGADHPSSGPEVGCRIEAAISLFKTRREAAHTLGISTDQLARYIKGESSPPLSVLIRLSHAKAISLDWLATGAGAMHAGAVVGGSSDADRLDEELNARVVDGISRLYKDERVGLSAMDLGRIAAKVYSDLVADFAPDERLVGLKGILAQMRRQLREPPAPGEAGKRSA